MSFEDRVKPCGICESTAFIWGNPVSGNGVWFKPEYGTGHELGKQSGLSGHGLILRTCKNCGNVQWFLKYYPGPDKSQKRKNDQL